jgi:hypothetical protein
MIMNTITLDLTPFSLAEFHRRFEENTASIFWAER